MNMNVQNFQEVKTSYEAALRLSNDPEKSNSNLSPIPDIPNLFKSIGQIGVSATVKKPCPLDSPCLNSLSKFSKVLDNNPNDIDTLMKRAELLVSIGDLKYAINDYTKILQLTPTNTEAILLMATSLRSYLRYESQGIVYTKCKPGWFSQCNEAIKSLDFVIDTNPNEAMAYFSRAELKRLVNSPDLSIEDLSKALNLQPNFVEAYVKRGLSYLEMDDPTSAIQNFNKAIELHPNSGHAYFEKGLTYNEMKEYKKAIENFNKSIELEPDNPPAYYGRGISRAKNGQDELAKEDFAQAC